jgi:hypothetical protein
MNIILAAGVCLYDHDETRRLSLQLAAALRLQGHNAEVMSLDAEPDRASSLSDQAVAVRSLRVDHAERLICLGWPSYLLAHPSKTIWLTCRSTCGGWHDDAVSASERSRLEQQEHEALSAARRRFALSPSILDKAARKSIPGIEPLGLPLQPGSAALAGAGLHSGDFVIVRWSRSPRARIQLGFAALARTQPPLRLVVTCETMRSDERDACHALARLAGVEDRVDVMMADPDQERLLLSQALGALDLSSPGLACGLWLDRAGSASTTVIVSDGGDASDYAPTGSVHLSGVPSIDEIAAALEGLRHSRQGRDAQGLPATPFPRPDWTQAVTALLS